MSERSMRFERESRERRDESALPEIDLSERFPGASMVAKKGSAGSGRAKPKSRRRAAETQPTIPAIDQLEVYLAMPPGESRNRVMEGFLAKRGDSLSVENLRRAAQSFSEEPKMSPSAEKKGTENPNREKLETEASLRQFMREGAIEAIRLAPSEKDLAPALIIDKIKLSLGYDPKIMSQVDLYSALPDGGKEAVKKDVEDELKARCNLALAQLKEDDFQNMKFGEATTKYKEALEGGTFVVAQVSNDTLKWLRTKLPRDSTEARRIGDISKHPLTRHDVDRAFQMFNLCGDAVEHFRELWSEGGDNKAKFFKVIPESDSEGEKTLLTDEGNRELELKLGVDIPDKYKKLIVDRITGKDKKSFYDGSDPTQRDTLKELLANDLGEDTENLAWQMFQGLRCEGLYFSGHYLGLLTLLHQSRNFLALNFDSWVGSKHNKIMVCRGGKLVDSEGKEVATTNYNKAALRNKNVVVINGKLYKRQTDNKKDLDIEKLMPDKDVPLQDGTVIPLKDAFRDDLRRVATGPLNQRITVDDIPDEYYKHWALEGRFLEMSGEGNRGDKSIEGQNSSVIVYGYEFRESLKKIRDLGASGDKTSQIGPAIEALNAIKKGGENLIGKGVLSVKDVRAVLTQAINDGFWELGVNNVFNIVGTQDVNKPNFLKPSGYNDMFERFAVIPSTGSPILESDVQLNNLRLFVEEWRKLSMDRLKAIAGINASDDDRKLLKKEDEQTRIVLPRQLGEKLKTPAEAFVSSFDQKLAGILRQK